MEEGMYEIKIAEILCADVHQADVTHLWHQWSNHLETTKWDVILGCSLSNLVELLKSYLGTFDPIKHNWSMKLVP